ncbi:MAG: carbonic anhydrase [Gemmatimonadaceae bacterium]
MDHRKMLRLPNEFAYILRSAGANLRDREFEVSYAVAVGGVRTIALLAHTNCGMAGVAGKREKFVRGLVEGAGWSRAEAERQFAEAADRYEIGEPVEFAITEVERLHKRYPLLLVAPLLYTLEDDRLVQLTATRG